MHSEFSGQSRFVTALLSSQHGEATSVQSAPCQPGWHWQVNELTPSTQSPPFKHGLPAHSSVSIAQLSPSKPATQEHL